MKRIFKPVLSKKISLWLLMSLVTSLGIVLFGKPRLSGAPGMAVALAYTFAASLVFTLLFYSLPYFRIEVDDRAVTGPGSPFGGWERVSIRLTDLDLQAARALLPWLGFYRIRSRSGQLITIWAFDEQQFAELLALLRERKAAGERPGLT